MNLFLLLKSRWQVDLLHPTHDGAKMHDFVCMFLTKLAHRISRIHFPDNLKKFYPSGKKFVNVRSILPRRFQLCPTFVDTLSTWPCCCLQWAFSSCTSSLEVLQSEQVGRCPGNISVHISC